MTGSYWASGLVHEDAIYWEYTGEIVDQSFFRWRDISEPNAYEINADRALRVKYQLNSVEWSTTLIGKEYRVLCEF